jgi:hypothetical protein
MRDDLASIREGIAISKRQIENTLIHVLRDNFEYLRIGQCVHSSEDVDMHDKIDVICRNLDDANRNITIAFRCQKERFAHFRSSTFTEREIRVYRQSARPLPTIAVHAYMTDDDRLVSMGVIEGYHLRNTIDWSRYTPRDSGGRKKVFRAVWWSHYPHLFRVIEPAPLFGQ